MDVQITPSAVEAFKMDYEDSPEMGFRLYLADKSWVGPRIRLVLDELEDEDNVLIIDGINVYYKHEVTILAKSLIIDYKTSFFKKKFFVERIK